MKSFWKGLKKNLKKFNEDNSGVGIVEVILILVVIYI